jgi:hypothetical protein
MECEVCKKELEKEKNSVVCSEHCKAVRQFIFDLNNKYFPTHGCDNCWGDLHSGCTEQCKKEFRESLEFGTDLWKLARIILNQ